jgi:hypothetical protein
MVLSTKTPFVGQANLSRALAGTLRKLAATWMENSVFHLQNLNMLRRFAIQLLVCWSISLT